MFRYISVALLAMLTGACASTNGVKFVEPMAPNDGDARIYVYRPVSPPTARAATVFINGKKVSDLSSNGYFSIEASPGKYSLTSKWSADLFIPETAVELNVIKGETYYVRVSSSMRYSGGFVLNGTYMPNYSMGGYTVIIDEMNALNEMKHCSEMNGQVVYSLKQ